MNPKRPLTRVVRHGVGSFKLCAACNGRGSVPCGNGKWYVEYHYQDGREFGHDFDTFEQAWEVMMAGRDWYNATVIGPDGYYYSSLFDRKKRP